MTAPLRDRSSPTWGRPLAAALLGAGLLLSGCVERLLEIRSDPEGADVWVNGELAGKTPLDHPFDHYGTFGVVLRREGHDSVRIVREIWPPWYEWFPLDFFAEVVYPGGIRDVHRFDARLEPVPALGDVRLLEELQRGAEESREVLRELDAADPEPRRR